ncbi:MAG TPA: hypothetical protein VMV49_12140 [Candidatus Deferrimicrobium sp.]|nr:hypothetical protein [Candidatus Deferrimicrobium sp.]
MGRKSQEDEICNEILSELHDLKQAKGITFNKLFNIIKKKRGKFSNDTLSKYLSKMEEDGRIIRIIDKDSNRKIPPTLLYKNLEEINLHNTKIKFNEIIMDFNTKFRQFPKKKLKSSETQSLFKELLLKILEKQMNINLNIFLTDEILDLDEIIENFNLYLVEHPDFEGFTEHFDDKILLFYKNLLELIIESDLMNIFEVHYVLLFHINFYNLFASIILQIVKKIQKEHLSLDTFFLKKPESLKTTGLTEDNILKLLLDQLQSESRKTVKDIIQKKRLDEFSEKYKSLEIY